MQINDRALQFEPINGYAKIRRAWQVGDTVHLDLDMPVVFVEGHPRVDPTRCSVALRRGPLVYYFEQVDQNAGVEIQDVLIDPSIAARTTWRGDLLDGVTQIDAAGYHQNLTGWDGRLYRTWSGEPAAGPNRVALRAVPYYAWANRGPNAMRVWVPVV